ncbi:hypothetical protein BGX38DRAFT_115054 [Terfezia claveryi]|nr:hypothetical protein BGX38DRAFT_115054 [Terfezia claveryi]
MPHLLPHDEEKDGRNAAVVYSLLLDPADDSSPRTGSGSKAWEWCVIYLYRGKGENENITYNSSGNSEYPSWTPEWCGPWIPGRGCKSGDDTLVLTKAPGRELNLLYFKEQG